MRAIALVFSARKKGNCYDFARFMLDKMEKKGLETELVNLCDYDRSISFHNAWMVDTMVHLHRCFFCFLRIWRKSKENWLNLCNGNRFLVWRHKLRRVYDELFQ